MVERGDDCISHFRAGVHISTVGADPSIHLPSVYDPATLEIGGSVHLMVLAFDAGILATLDAFARAAWCALSRNAAAAESPMCSTICVR